MPSEDGYFRAGEDASRRGRKGGIKGGEARRRRRDLRELAQALIDANLTPEQLKKSPLLKNKYLSASDRTQGALMLLAQLDRAQKGDSKAATLLLGLIGLAPTAKTEISGSITVGSLIAEIAARTHDEKKD